MRAAPFVLVPFIAVSGLILCCDDGSPGTADGSGTADARPDDFRFRGDHTLRPDFGGLLVDSVPQVVPEAAAEDAFAPDLGGQNDAVACGPDGTPCELDHDSCTNEECQGGQCITISVGINGLACSAAGQMGTCLYAACCTGCLSGSPKVCVTGNTDSACGSAGASCVDCTSGAATHCCGGACQAAPCP